MKNRTWAEIDLGTAARNFHAIKAQIPPGVKIMAVVKADAYGHGAVRLARVYEREGADFLGVACIDEAAVLARAGVSLPLVVLGPVFPESVEIAKQADAAVPVFSAESLAALSQASAETPGALKVHIKVDTGMGRIGFYPSELKEHSDALRRAQEDGSIKVEGVFSHFAVSDMSDSDSRAYTTRQYESFRAVCRMLEEAGFTGLFKHVSNSAGTLFGEFPEQNLVRPGIHLYMPVDPGAGFEFEPALGAVMSVKTRVTMVKCVPAGTDIGYGRTFTTAAPTDIATVCMGYADGYPRLLSGGGRMLVRGKSAPVIGRVCMDQLMLDVTGISGIVPGDIVTVVGRDGDEEISFYELAGLVGTSVHELTCGISPRAERVYREDIPPKG